MMSSIEQQEANYCAIDQVTRATFIVLPLLKKKLLRMDVIQAEHGMPMSHVQVLAMLGTEKVMSVTSISHRLGVAKPNITPLVDRLIECGYVERQRNEMDRRVVNVMLLPKGKDKLEGIYQSIVDHIGEWVGDEVDEDDFIELERALHTIESILSDSPLKDEA